MVPGSAAVVDASVTPGPAASVVDAAVVVSATPGPAAEVVGAALLSAGVWLVVSVDAALVSPPEAADESPLDADGSVG